MRPWQAAGLLLAIAALGAPLSAWAAQSAAAGPQLGPSPNGPIDISADSTAYVASTCQSTWSGSAEVLQGSSRLRASVIRVFFKKKPSGSGDAVQHGGGEAGLADSPQSNCGPIDRIVADGNVFYVTPGQVVHGQRAVYTADDDEIVMTGDVIVVQGKDVVRGDKMTLHVATREVRMESKAKGRGTPGRVRAVLYSGQPGAPGLAAPSR